LLTSGSFDEDRLIDDEQPDKKGNVSDRRVILVAC
jgi:hypothetical protein